MIRFCLQSIVHVVLLVVTCVVAQAAPYAYVPLQPDMRWAYAIEGDDQSCSVTLSHPTFDVISEGTGVVMQLSGTTAWTQPGQPRLPVFPVLFQLDESVSFTIEVQPGEFYDQIVGELLPETGPFSVSENDETTRLVKRGLPDPEIYLADSYWPTTYYEVNEAKGGGRRYLRIGLTPFHYHPLTRSLRSYPELKIVVRFSEPTTSGATP